MPLFALAQNQPFEYKESLDQPYMSVSKQHRRTSPPYRLNGTAFSIRQVNVDAAGQNILNDAANEPSLVIDPTNPQRMAIGWRQFDTIASNFRQAGVAFSFDAGETWQNQAPIEQGIFRSDPVLDADTEGNFYYNSLSSSTGDFLCHVFKSEAGSNTWGTGVFAQGGDKQWMAIDRTGMGSNGNVYAFWKMGLSSCIGGFTRSLDGGETYEPCELLVDDPVRGTLVVSPTGELYACGSSANSFVVLKSSQPGATAFEWDVVTSVNLGGSLSYASGPNPNGMLGQVWVDVDNSGGPNQGFVYLLATVNNGIDPADIIIARSTDGGLTWGDPVHINDDGIDGNWQWFGSLSVSPTGRIDVTWFDTRDNPGTFLSRLYYSYSDDGGLTWSPNEALSDAFDPHLGWPQQQKLGDYNHQRSDSLGAHLAWAATLNGEQDVFYSYIQPNFVSGSRAVAAQQSSVTVVPNPFSGSTSFRFSMKQPGHVQVVITDARGAVVEVLDGVYLGAGEQVIEWREGREAGLYFYQLMVDGDIIGAGKLVKTN
jgi:hypothetical protein